MRTLELKDLAGYLPYGLKLFVEKDHSDREVNDTFILNGLTEKTLGYRSDNEGIHVVGITLYRNAKPILKPLSLLTEPCLDGKIPIVELANVVCNSIWGFDSINPRSICEVLNYGNNFGLIHVDDSEERIGFSFETECNKIEFFFSVNGDRMKINQLQLFQKLFEWHFDVYGLIEQGLAVSEETIKN